MAVLVCYQHCFSLVVVGARKTLAPTVTERLALLELECGVMSSLVPCWCGGVVTLGNKTAEYSTCAAEYLKKHVTGEGNCWWCRLWRGPVLVRAVVLKSRPAQTSSLHILVDIRGGFSASLTRLLSQCLGVCINN